MKIQWLEQAEADVPAGNDWLSFREVISLSRLRFPKRRGDWRLGRWTAKCALADFLGLPNAPKVLAGIELRPAPSGAPEVFLYDKPSTIVISLSHRAGIAACAIATSEGVLGCDLEIIEPRSDAFVGDYFTAEERALVEQAPTLERFRRVALLWSAKESALKTLRTGLRLDTRNVLVSLGNEFETRRSVDESLNESYVWHPLQVHCDTNRQIFNGWWSQTGNLLRTVVASPPPAPPDILNPKPVFPSIAGGPQTSAFGE